jgi:hypothetical protein
MKLATADAEFAELKGSNRVVARGQGSSAALAAARAVRYLFDDPKVKGRRIANLNVTIHISTPTLVATAKFGQEQ